jgi:hypothetical protein
MEVVKMAFHGRRERTMAHRHNHCQHTVEWCRDCNVVFCSKCAHEWTDEPKITWQYTPQQWPYYPYWMGSGSLVGRSDAGNITLSNDTAQPTTGLVAVTCRHNGAGD